MCDRDNQPFIVDTAMTPEEEAEDEDEAEAPAKPARKRKTA